LNEGHGVPPSQRKRLPQDLEAERSVLGSVLVNNSTLDQVREIGLEVRDYFLDAHQKIFEAACALSDTGKPVDLVTLTSTLRDRGWYDSIGGVGTLTISLKPGFLKFRKPKPRKASPVLPRSSRAT